MPEEIKGSTEDSSEEILEWDDQSTIYILVNNSHYKIIIIIVVISPFRVRVDECDRLWVLDSGMEDLLGKPKQVAPQAILIFDLKSNAMIKRFNIPMDHIKEDTIFPSIVSNSEPLIISTYN